MAGFFSATNIADVLSVQRIAQTTQLIAKATKTDEKLGGLDSFLGEKFDLGMATMPRWNCMKNDGLMGVTRNVLNSKSIYRSICYTIRGDPSGDLLLLFSTEIAVIT